MNEGKNLKLSLSDTSEVHYTKSVQKLLGHTVIKIGKLSFHFITLVKIYLLYIGKLSTCSANTISFVSLRAS